MLSSTLTAFLFLGQVYGGILDDVTLMRRGNSMEDKMRRYADSVVEPLRERQSTAAPLNVTSWNEQTTSACTTALSALDGVASNPSGIAACYNLPFWDNTTGQFHADLRLFMISQPSGSFANISPSDVKVELSYTGATVSTVNNSALKRREDHLFSIPLPRSELGQRQTQTPTLTQTYAFFGQVNQAVLSDNSSTIQQSLVPVVKLTAVDSQGQTVSTNLSTSEATFVNGVFAQQEDAVTESSVAGAMQTLVVAAGEPFVVPGTHILIAPIGGIVTGAWALLLIATITYGTVGRQRFKDQYRRRVARAVRGNVATI